MSLLSSASFSTSWSSPSPSSPTSSSPRWSSPRWSSPSAHRWLCGSPSAVMRCHLSPTPIGCATLCFPLHRATFNVTLEHSALHYIALRLTLHICSYVTLQRTLLWHLQCTFYMTLHCVALTKHKCTVLNYVTIRYIALHCNGCIGVHYFTLR